MAITAAAQPNTAPTPNAVRNAVVLIMQTLPAKLDMVNDLQGSSFRCFRGLRRRIVRVCAPPKDFWR